MYMYDPFLLLVNYFMPQGTLFTQLSPNSPLVRKWDLGFYLESISFSTSSGLPIPHFLKFDLRVDLE